MQPEAALSKKIKDAIKKIFPDALVDKNAGSPMGSMRLDITICLFGHYGELEVKMPGKKPTARQEYRIREVHKAGGYAGWTDNVDGAMAFAKMMATGEPQLGNPMEKFDA